MSLRRVLIVSAVLAVLVPAGRVHAATFTFDSLAFGAATPLVLTDGGVTATFTSPDVSDFLVFPAAGFTTS